MNKNSTRVDICTYRFGFVIEFARFLGYFEIH